MKRFINQETVMLVALSLVVLVVMFGATVAWFVGATPAGIENMNLEADDKGELYVYVKTEQETDSDGTDGLSVSGNTEEDETESEEISEIESETESESDTETESETEYGTESEQETESNTDIESLANGSGDDVDVQDESESQTEEQTRRKPVEKIMEEDGFVPLKSVGTGDNVSYKIDMNLVDQDNILKKTFAPGAYGKVVFKILSRTSIIKGYKIRITPSIKAAAGLSNTALGLTEDDLLNLVKSHIKFYATLDNDNNEYKDVIMYDKECMYNNGTDYTDGLEGSIDEDEVKYVTLYWYWPYEYTDIPASLDITNTAGKFYEEFKKFTGKTENECIEEYDWDDTYIGNFVEKLTFHFDVETIR